MLTNNDMMKLKTNVTERISWGIDPYTYKNIRDVLNHQDRDKFIEVSLQKAINLHNKNGWDIKEALKFIIEESKQKNTINPLEFYEFSNSDRKMAK